MPSNTHTVIGHTKRFECRVVGHPRPEIRWFKDGRDITHHDRYRFDYSYEGIISMIIEDIYHNDQGSYRCRAENTEGFASTTAYLLVRAHKAHPDEEIEEVHSMELEEHFVYKSDKDTNVITEPLEEYSKRTFEQVVDKERENTREIMNGAVSKSSLLEESYGKTTMNGYEETRQSSSKKVTSVSEEGSSVIISEEERLLESKSAKSKSKSSVSETEESSSSSSKRTEEKSMSVSASLEETKVKAKTESKESEMIVGVSVETEESSSSLKSKKESKSILKTSVETEESSEKSKELNSSGEIEEEKRKSDKALLSTEVTTESSKKETEESNKLTADVKVEEVSEECRLELQGTADNDDKSLDTADSALTSLGHDSGFLESSLLESSQLEESIKSAAGSEATEDTAKVSAETVTKSKAESVKVESHVEESKLSVSSETTSVVEKTVTTTVTTTTEQAKAEEVTSRTEKTAISQEISRADETTEETSKGDITGLLDEKPAPETAVVEQVIEDEEQKSKWVDQITSRTETIKIESEGKKVDELNIKEDTAVAAEKQEEKADLKQATTKSPPETSVDVESLASRQGSVIGELAVVKDEVADSTKERKKKGHEERLEVDENLSAQNTLGLEKVPSHLEVESSVDFVEHARNDAAEEEKLTLKSEVDVEETKKDKKAEEEMKITAETSVDESKAKSAPKVASVPEDVSVELGQIIRLVSQVQGSPQPEVKWFKEGDTVKAGDRITLHTEDDVFTLEISDAATSDGGTYTLTAHNSEGTIFSDVVVTVTVPPRLGPADDEIRVTASLTVPEFVVQPGKVTVKELGTLELVCTITASPAPTVVWSKEGKTLESDSHVSIFESEGQYSLKVPKATTEDCGDYTCTATNSQGSVTCNISVLVQSSATEEGAARMVPLSQLESSSDEMFLHTYQVTRAYRDEETTVVFVVGEVVEVLDSKRKSNMWLVRKQSEREQVCFIPSSHLKEWSEAEAEVTAVKKREQKTRSPTNRLSSSEIEHLDTSEDEDRMKRREKYPDCVVIADYNPPSTNGEESVKLTEGQIVEVMDMERADRWLVQTRPTKTSTAKQGWVPPAYLEVKTTGGPASRRSTREVFREDVLQISNKQQEASLKRSSEDQTSDAISAKYAVTELVESEREYTRDLKKVIDSYYKRLSRRSTPSVLKDKRDLIFSNLNDIMDFHTDVFLKILEASVANPGTIGDAFLVKEKKFNMYVSYWLDQLSTKVFVETEEAQEFLREYSRSIGDSELTFPRLLECPISRLMSYQTLLKDILRYTSRAGDDCTSLERAIAMLASIELQVKHTQLLHNIEGLPGDASSLGQLIRHDDVILWDSDTSTTRGKERHVFLFKDKVVITKRKKGDSPADQPSFVFKAVVELGNVQLNENVTEDERRFELWFASSTTERHSLQTGNLASKQAWLKDTRELLKALGIEETDIMPEKTTELSNAQATRAAATQKKKAAEKTSTVSVDSGSESDRTLTDGDYASLSSYDSDISSYHTANEFEDGSSRPVLKKRPKKTVCQEGSAVKFDCIVGGTPLPTVQWLKDGSAIKESKQVQISSEGDTSTLTLLSVSKGQAGQYSALAANLNGSILAAADLVVLEELGLEKTEPGQDQEAFQLDDKTPTEEVAPTPFVLDDKTPTEEVAPTPFELDDKTPTEEVAPTPFEETKTAAEEKQITTPVVKEEKPVVEEPVVPEATKVEEEKPVEPEPTPVVEEEKPEPVVEEKAPEPVEEEKPEPVVEEEKPEPVVEDKKPEPVEEEKPEPVVEDKKPEPVEEEKPEPVVEEKKPEPVVEENKPEPVVEEKKPEPVVEEKKPEPVVEENKPEPVVEEKKPEPVVEEKAPEPVVQEKKPEPVVEEKKPEPVVEEKKPEPVVEEKKPEPVVEEKKPEPVVEEKKPEPVVEEKKPEPVVEEKKVEKPVVEEKKPAEPEQVEEKKPEPVKEEKPVEPEPVKEEKPVEPEPVKEEKPVEPEPKPVVKEEVVEEKKPVEQEPAPVEEKKVEEPEPVAREAEETAKAEEPEQKFKSIPETAEGEVSFRAPHFLSDMNDIVVELGHLARFDCRVAAYPDPDITWLKDGNNVVPTERYILQNFHDDIFSLLIKDAKTTDSGCYACVAKNEYGEAKTEALLNVLSLKAELEEGDMAPSFATKFGNVEGIEGVPVEFTCQIKGRPPPTVTWLINGREVAASLDVLTRQQDDTIMLAFRSVQMEHSGDIVCKLKNHLGEATCRAKLIVNEDLSKKGEEPLFVEKPSDLEVTEGGEARFECVITGTPEPEVIWYFNGRELFDSRRRVIRKKGEKYQLILREVIPDNAGVYTCKAVNAAGDASCAVELSVKELPKEPKRGRAPEEEEADYSFPPTFTRRLLDQRVAPGHTARFECLMLGIPLPDVVWQKDGITLKPSDKFRIGREGSTAILEVDGAEAVDAGEYTCILTNDAGKATSRAGLTVQEERRVRYATPKLEVRAPEFGRAPSRGREDLLEPGRPPLRELSPEEKVPSMPFDKPSLLEVRDTSVKLGWLPARTSNLPDKARHITYTIEAREMPSNRWTRLASGLEGTSYVARNLRPTKEYIFRVHVENKYGSSDPTLPATLAPREEPEEKKRLYGPRESPAPLRFPATKPYVMDIGAETLRLGWKPAEVERRMDQPPISYRIEAQKLPSEEWVPLASRVHDTSLYLSDLEPDRDYNVRVRAQGPYGVSQPTAPVWLPRATGFSGVPVSRPMITELEPGTVRLQWHRVDVPAFAHEQEHLTYMLETQEPPSSYWREAARDIRDTSYTIHDLEPATDYRFRVRAQNREGLRSEPSPATSIHRTLALSRPPIDRVEILDYDKEYETVGLAWRRVEVPPFDSEEEPLLYMIESQEPLTDSWRTLVSGIPTTRYRIPDVGPTQDYNFRVRALTPYGMSPPSPATGLYRSPTPSRPMASDLYISSMEPESMRLSWQPSSFSLPSSRATTPAYQIESLEYPSTQWRPLASDVRDTSYQLTGLAPTRDYSFRVRASTPSGGLTEPTYPVTVSSLPVRPRLPSREPVIKEMGADSVRLQWGRAELPYYQRQVAPITYSVEMQEVPGHVWTPVRRGIPETSYMVTGLRSDRDYRFRIRPETEFGPGEYSLPVHAYRKPSVTMPSREPMICDVGPSSVTLAWQPAKLPSGVQSTRPITYRIEMREPPSGYWSLMAERVPATSYRVNFLNPDRDYSFRVYAELDGVESEPTPAAYLPHRMGPPKMLREPPYISSVHPDSVWLSWRSVDIPARITDYAPVTYRIEAQEPPSMEWRPLARHIPVTHFHLQGLRPGQEYSFRVRAENDIGLSEPTPSVLLPRRSVTPSMPQSEPLISDVAPGSLRLSWRPAEVPSFLLDSMPVTYSIHYQHLPDSDWHPLARRVAGTNYYVTGLSPDNNYTFRVLAENQFGTSKPTHPARMPRLAEIRAPIYSPEIEEVEPSSLRLAWKMPRLEQYKSKKTTYSIETLEPSTWAWRPLASNLPTPSYRVSTLSPTQDYVFRVRAQTDNILSEPSFPISYSRTRAPPSVPVERPIISEIEPDSVRVAWHPIHYPSLGRGDGSRRYRLEMRELPYGSWAPALAQTTKLSHEVTGLRPNMDYSFRVSVLTDTGVSSPSNAAYLYRRAVIPRLPLELPELAEVGDDYASLRWKRVDVPAYEMDDEPLSFMVEAQRLPSYEWEPVARGITDTKYKVSGLKQHQDYAFRVRGELPSGLTSPSAPIPLYRRPERAGVPISYVTIDDHNVPPYSARIRWKPVYIPQYSSPSSTLYQVEMREPPQRDWRPLGSDIRGTEFMVSDLSPRKNYMFRVRAKSPAGVLSDPSMSVPFYPLHTRQYDSHGGGDLLMINEDYSLPNRPYINTLIVKVPPRMHIEKPDMFSVNPSTVHLTWNPARVPSATSQLSPTTYRVEVREDGTFNWVEKASNLTGLGTDIKCLNPLVDYAFRVRAINDFGWSEATLPVFLHRPIDFTYDEPDINWDSFSPTVPPLVAPRLPIDSPRITPVSPAALKLSWQPARIPAYARKSPITYSVEMRDLTGHAWSPVSSKLTDTSFQVSGLDPVRPYLFRVRADSEFGSSEPTLPAELSRTKPTASRTRSESVDRPRPTDGDLDSSRRGSFIDSITTGVPPRVPTGRPTISNATETSLVLSWPAARLPAYLKNTKLDYIIESREGTSRLWNVLAENVTDTSYKVTGLDPEEDYMFRVRSHNESGTSEPTLPATLERPKKKAPTPQRRGSSVERRSLDRRSQDRMSERRSMSRASVDRRSESRLGREGRKDGEEPDTLPGMTPEDFPLAPEFSRLDKEDVQYGVESHPMTISLQLRGYPPPQVTWYHQGKKLELGDRYDTYVTPTGQVFLEFLNMGWQDMGDYKCVAENEQGTAEKTVKVDVADPPTFIEPVHDVKIPERSQAVLTCAVDGIPYPTVRFMRDWRPLTDTSRLLVTNDAAHPERWTLTISDAIPADSGSYMCVAENPAGKIFCTARVTVDDVAASVTVDYKDTCSLEDNYYVLQELGRGRHGRVRHVVEKSTGKEYAAKFIQVREAVDKEFFRSEVDMLRKQKSKNVVSVHDAYETPRQLIIIMDLLPGGELLDRVAQDSSWTEGKAAGVVKQLLETLQHVHSNLVAHMDIKPSNLLLSGDSLDSAKLIDFGLARRVPPSQDTLLNHGTPGFVSPEAIDVKPISSASDVWGVGVLAFILLGGQSPFQADSVAESLKKTQACDWSFDISKAFASVSQDAKDFITKILKKNADDRLSVDECLAHPWLKKTDGGAKLDVSLIKAFQEKDKKQREATAARTVAYLRTLQRQLTGVEVTEKCLRPAVDPKTSNVSFPDTDGYGEFLDSESWYEWQSRYGQGPDSGLVPLKDPEYTARIRGYKRSVGSLDESSSPMDAEEEAAISEREKFKMMKERRQMADIDKEAIPPSLEKELEWLEGRKQARKAKEPQRQDSVDSRRSSVSTEGDGTGPAPVFRQRLQDLSFETGDTITMYCALEGPPPYSTVWYRNEELLSDGARVKQELSEDGQATLTITAAKPYDAGVYKCVARSKSGRASTRMRLLQGDVPERPGWPVVVQVEAKDAVLLWESPRFDGNCPILYYRVDYKPRGDARWSTAAYTTLEMCLVTELKPETAYRFRVSATNLLGRGPFSWASVEVTTKKQGSVSTLTTGDLKLELLKQRQDEAKEIANKPTKEAEAPEESQVDKTPPTLLTSEPDKEFAITETIWKGKFGELKDCINKKTSKSCLVKCVPATLTDGQHEYDILKTVSHETVLRLMAAYSTKSTFFLVFEGASGEHVAQRLSLRRRYSEDCVAHIMRQVLYGLQYLHRNSIVHLNLQPSSLLLTAARGFSIKLTDFSLAQALTNGAEEVAVPRKGYPDFIPPEVVAKQKAMLASDVWGVGTLTFLLLSGLSPFAGESDEETLINVAYSRYDAGDLLDGVSNEALKFLYKIMKLLPRNRPSVQDCLEHKWLQLTDSMMKTRENNLFRSNRLRQFVLSYDSRRQSEEHRILFDSLVLPPELAATLSPDVLTADVQETTKDTAKETELKKSVSFDEAKDAKPKTEELSAASEPGKEEAEEDVFEESKTELTKEAAETKRDDARDAEAAEVEMTQVESKTEILKDESKTEQTTDAEPAPEQAKADDSRGDLVAVEEKTEAQVESKTEPAKEEEPVTEEVKTDAKGAQVEETPADTPAVEEEKKEVEPVTEEPLAEETKTDTKDAQVEETPADTPAVEEEKKEVEPVTEEPLAEETKTDAKGAQVEETPADTPAVEEEKKEVEPVTEEPLAEETKTDTKDAQVEETPTETRAAVEGEKQEVEPQKDTEAVPEVNEADEPEASHTAEAQAEAAAGEEEQKEAQIGEAAEPADEDLPKADLPEKGDSTRQDEEVEITSAEDIFTAVSESESFKAATAMLESLRRMSSASDTSKGFLAQSASGNVSMSESRTETRVTSETITQTTVTSGTETEYVAMTEAVTDTDAISMGTVEVEASTSETTSEMAAHGERVKDSEDAAAGEATEAE
ncbi:obscurin-like isoform X2 [Littorina saxatilis]|uniref:obscurin-like isoform X2 n=1 Tax=Littorina saxatilis TaxID=31220 RepID=UPI0038B43A50